MVSAISLSERALLFGLPGTTANRKVAALDFLNFGNNGYSSEKYLCGYEWSRCIM